MSTPTESGVAEGKMGDRRMSLGKYVKRMSSVFRREKQSKSSAPDAAAAPSVPDIQKAATNEEDATKHEAA
jgi:hypothetical protein